MQALPAWVPLARGFLQSVADEAARKSLNNFSLNRIFMET
jgi:hypothetical protein